jgi:predicted metal-dependent hydrolase
MSRQALQVGSPPLEVVLKTNPRARRLTLRVSSITGEATLTVPRGTNRRAVETFVTSQEDWLRSRLGQIEPVVMPTYGEQIPVEGRMLVLAPGSSRIRIEGESLLVGGNPEHLPARLKAYLRTLARDRLVGASEEYAERLGRKLGRITLRDTRSRWGSCTEKGDLMYSWRLVMAPAEVLEYVAAHEVAHIIEMNHSDRFWRVVEKLMPGYRKHRNWLRENGAGLHRYKF